MKSTLKHDILAQGMTNISVKQSAETDLYIYEDLMHDISDFSN